MVNRPAPVSGESLTFEDMPELLTVKEATEALRMSKDTLYVAIRSGELPAFIPRGRDPRRAGRSMGYRIHRADLQRWYFGGS